MTKPFAHLNLAHVVSISIELESNAGEQIAKMPRCVAGISIAGRLRRFFAIWRGVLQEFNYAGVFHENHQRHQEFRGYMAAGGVRC